MEIDEMYELQEALATYFTNSKGFNITRENIFDALFIVFENEEKLEWGGDVWDLQIDFDSSVSKLTNFDFKSLINTFDFDYQLPKEFLFMETKVQIKNSGVVWVIHKYDADPFPSNPHAHQMDNNLKLDLSTGDLYRKKKWVGQIPKKEFLQIREKIENAYYGELPKLR